MSLQIYGIARTRAFRALWVAKELGIDYEHLPIEIGDAGARTPEFLAINPNGRLPVIVDGDFVLFESLAITMYLAKKHSPGKLYPASLEGEARTWQWSLWAVTEVDRGVNIWSLHAVRLPEAERDAAKREEAFSDRQRVHRRRPQRGRRHQPRGRHGSRRIAEPEGLARSLPRPACRARCAGAEVEGRS
jgi:glutathione S-transferase